MDKPLVNAIKAANAHKKVGTTIRSSIKPGMSLKDIVLLVEDNIKKEILFDINSPLDKGIAFPVGLSLNNCAAHYTPNYNENTIILKESDILKIDYGIHVNGIIIDSAFTMHFDNKYDEFIQISKDITNYGVSLCGPDVVLGDIGVSIEEYIESKEITIDGKIIQLKTMSELSGHSIAHYDIHAGKAVPNTRIFYPVRMKENEFYAIEPFITTGLGKNILKEPNSQYMLAKEYQKEIHNIKNNEKKLLDIILNNYYTLPFCQRWLYEINNIVNHNNLLKNLENKKIVNTYPPIYDINKSIVSQFEHTIFIKKNGIINLTKNDFY